MGNTVLCVAVMILGVKFGAQPLPDGGVEYVIQVEPLVLESLKSGIDIHSDIPLNVRDLRSFRITVQSDRLPPDLRQPQKSTSPSAQPDFVGPRGTMFPNTPPGSVPLPKMSVNRDAPGPADFRVKTKELPANDPALLPPGKDLKPIAEEKTSFFDRSRPVPSAAAPPRAEEKTPGAATATPELDLPKPSLTLTLSLAVTTVGSFGGMMFFGWVAWDYRSRYCALLQSVHGTPEQHEPDGSEEDENQAETSSEASHRLEN